MFLYVILVVFFADISARKSNNKLRAKLKEIGYTRNGF